MRRQLANRLPLRNFILLALLALPFGCSKDVQEVRRRELGPVAPASEERTAGAKVAPAAPDGEPVGITGKPKTP